MFERSVSIWLRDWSAAWMSAVAWGSCAAPAAGSAAVPAGATGLPGAGAEFAATDGALAGAVETVTGPASAGMLLAELGAAARVPVGHAVASAPTSGGSDCATATPQL